MKKVLITQIEESSIWYKKLATKNPPLSLSLSLFLSKNQSHFD